MCVKNSLVRVCRWDLLACMFARDLPLPLGLPRPLRGTSGAVLCSVVDETVFS